MTRPASDIDAMHRSDAIDRVMVLGIGVSAVTVDLAISIIEQWIQRRTPNYACLTGAHGVIESRSDSQLCAIHNAAGLVAPDGMPLVFMAHRLGFKHVARVYGPELMRRLSARSAHCGYRQFYYGGGPGLAERLAATLKALHPGLVIAGTMTPSFGLPTREEEEATVASIKAAAPDIVWVGLSTPKQEVWMASHVKRLNIPVLIGVGAAFDFLAGTKPQAPGWMQRSGLEWAYRLACEPRRLWRRYARIVPLFLLLALRQLIAQRLGNLHTNTSHACRQTNRNFRTWVRGTGGKG
jgi:N-acetylglucosaminyldiphosphoundecaprenol N-acetyl-beta-D-mannosaminyltransferase